MHNVHGQLLQSMVLESRNGQSQHPIVVDDLPVGTYWFRLVIEEETVTKRWVKVEYQK